MCAIYTSVKDPGFDSEEAKKRKDYMVRLFNYQAPHYDLHDDIIGFGIHRGWGRDVMGEVSRFMQGRRSAYMLDLACGTGFITFNVARNFTNIKIDAFDITPGMVEEAKKRKAKKFADRDITFWVGDAEITYGENKYDLVATCFAFRNFANKNLAAENAFKAIKPGGAFILQDMTKPEKGLFRQAYLFAFKHLLPLAARIVGTEKGAPRYLYNSVMAMPKNADISIILASKGFTNIRHRYQSWGMGTLVVAEKPKE